MTIIVRRALADESDAVAALFRRTRKHCLPYLPRLHTPDEDRWFFRERVFATAEVWVAADGGIVGFAVARGDWLEHLYIAPEYQSLGLGTRLLEVVRTSRPLLRLWAFQRNAAARRFYERRGFRTAETTDGRNNEEREPDILYVWSQHACAVARRD